MEANLRYARQNDVKELIQGLAQGLALQKPADPIRHLIRQLRSEVEDLSRLEWAYGSGSMSAWRKSVAVGVFGLRGVGVETARNLALTSPDIIRVHDDEKVTENDTHTELWYPKQSIGKRRSAELVPKLQALNANVDVQLHTGEIRNEDLKELSVAIFTGLCPEWNQKRLIEIDQYCSEHSIKFIWIGGFGVSLSMFTNFGQHTTFLKPKKFKRPIVLECIRRVQAPYKKVEDFLRAFLPEYIVPGRMSSRERIEWSRKVLRDILGEDAFVQIQDTLSCSNSILELAESLVATRDNNTTKFEVSCSKEFHPPGHGLNDGDCIYFKAILPKDTKSMRYPARPKHFFRLADDNNSGGSRDQGSGFKCVKYLSEEKDHRQLLQTSSKSIAFQVMVHRTNPHVFYISDVGDIFGELKSSDSHLLSSGGLAEVLEPEEERTVTVKHKSLRDMLKTAPADEVKGDQSIHVRFAHHMTLLGLLAYQEAYNKLPDLGDSADADKVVDFTDEIQAKFKTGNMNLVRPYAEKLSKVAGFEALGMCVTAGGLATHVAIKAFAASEVLCEQWTHLPLCSYLQEEEGVELRSGESVIFGTRFEENAAGVRVLVAGLEGASTAMMRALTAMGVGIQRGIYVADSGRISLGDIPLGSGLWKYPNDIGELRSIAVSNNLWANSVGFVKSVDQLPAPGSEKDAFPCSFWSSLDLVVLDSSAMQQEDCKYISDKCRYHNLPLLTLYQDGVEGGFCFFVPGNTISYAEQLELERRRKSNCPYYTDSQDLKWILTSEECVLAAIFLHDVLFSEECTSVEELSDKYRNLSKVYPPRDLRAWMQRAMSHVGCRGSSGRGTDSSAERRQQVRDRPRIGQCVSVAYKMFVLLFRDVPRKLEYEHEVGHTETGAAWWKLLCAPGMLRWDPNYPGMSGFIWATSNMLKDLVRVEDQKEFKMEDCIPLATACYGGSSISDTNTMSRGRRETRDVGTDTSDASPMADANATKPDGKPINSEAAGESQSKSSHFSRCWIRACSTLLAAQRGLAPASKEICDQALMSRYGGASPAVSNVAAGLATLEVCKMVATMSSDDSDFHHVFHTHAPPKEASQQPGAHTENPNTNSTFSSGNSHFDVKHIILPKPVVEREVQERVSWAAMMSQGNSGESKARNILAHLERNQGPRKTPFEVFTAPGANVEVQEEGGDELRMPKMFAPSWDFLELYRDIPVEDLVNNFGSLMGVETRMLTLDRLVALPPGYDDDIASDKFVLFKREDISDDTGQEPDATVVLTKTLSQAYLAVVGGKPEPNPSILVFGLEVSARRKGVPNWLQKYLPGSLKIHVPHLRLHLENAK